VGHVPEKHLLFIVLLIKSTRGVAMRKFIALALLCLATQTAAAGDDHVDPFNTLESVDRATSNAEKLQKKLDQPQNKNQKEGQEWAEEISSFYYSDAFQKRISAETERLKSTIFKNYLPGNQYSEPEKEKPNGNHENLLLPSERIYIFISSSIPVETLRAYVRDVDKIGDPRIVFVMNGFVGGMRSFKETLDFIVSIKTKDPGCSLLQGECSFYRANLQIDPLLFRKYQITSVPAVVYAAGRSLMNADRPDHEANISNYYVIKGDASLEHHLEVIRREVKSVSLENILTALRSGYYSGK